MAEKKKLVIREEEAEEFVPALHFKCLTKKYLTEEVSGAKNMSVFRSDFDVGGRADPHTHEVEQAYYIIEGKALVTMDDEEYEIGEKTMVLFPPHVRHSIKNIGDKPLSILAINAPPL